MNCSNCGEEFTPDPFQMHHLCPTCVDYYGQCGRGHPYTDENTRYYVPPQPKVIRICKECERIRTRQSYYKRKTNAGKTK